jgi:TonB family protein
MIYNVWNTSKKQFFSERYLFRNAVLASILFHLLLVLGLFVKKALDHGPSISRLEIDLTKPFRIGGNPLLKPGGGTSLTPIKVPGIPAKAESSPVTQPPAKPKDWILPGPDTKQLEKPGPEAAPVVTSPYGIPEGTGEGYQGTGGGFGGGEGQGGGIPIEKFPQLLNRSEILKLLRKLYPAAEREAGIESVVVVDLHLDAQGSVVQADLVGSGGQDFDEVAQTVAKKMRFSPAKVKGGPIPVKIRQSITFRLED